MYIKLNLEMQAWNPSTWEVKTGGLGFKAFLCAIANMKPAWATQDPVSNNNIFTLLHLILLLALNIFKLRNISFFLQGIVLFKLVHCKLKFGFFPLLFFIISSIFLYILGPTAKKPG